MLHKSPYIWIIFGVGACLAVAVSQDAAASFLGICLLIDGACIIWTRVLDLGDWQGNDTGYVFTGFLAQLQGVVSCLAGLYLLWRFAIA